MFGHGQNLYFFDEERRIPRRRQRKPIEQLPFSLPFTGVSGTLKVEAYLRQQLKISEAVGESLPQTPDTNNEEKVEKDASLPEEHQAKRKAKLFTTFSDHNDVDEEEDTQKFLFEENKFAAPNLLAHLGRILEVLYETQADNDSARGRTVDNWANLTTSNNRYLDFSTSNFSLRTLGIAIPFHLAEKLKWNFEQLIVNTVYTKRQWQTIGYKHQAPQSVTEEFPNSQQQAMSELREESKSAGDNIEDEGKGKNPQCPDISHGSGKRGSFSKKSQKSTEHHVQKPVINIETSAESNEQSSITRNKSQHLTDSLKPSLSALSTLKQDSSGSQINLRDGEVPKSVQGFRRESLKNVNVKKTPRTRLEKYKYIPDKSILATQWKKKVADKDVTKEPYQGKEKDEKKMADESGVEYSLGKETEKDFVSFHKLPREYEASHSITFSLMSKTCEDNGWVHHVSPDADLERLTVIEWARARLQEAINKSSEYNLGVHGSQLVIKQYGESKIDPKQAAKIGMKEGENSLVCITKFVTYLPEQEDTILKQPRGKKTPSVVFKEYGEGNVQKTKKGKQKIKRTSSGTAILDLFVIVLPDETLNLYYPSGKIAVCTARNMVGEGKYTYIYSNDDESLLAYFTPTNAFCRDETGKLFMCTPKEGRMFNKENAITQQWLWKTAKLKTAIGFEINDFLTLKIVNRGQMNLHFSARQETYKVNVGITQDFHCTIANSAGEMMTTGDYLSDVARQHTVVKTAKVPRTRREERKWRLQQRNQSLPGNPEDLQEQRREDLDKLFPERKNLALDLPSDVDLYKMRRKIKGLVYKWMESYRLLAGISTPVKIPDNRAHRQHPLSAKSLPGKMPSTSHVTFKLSEPAVKAAHHRVPSAPPLPRGQKTHVMELDTLVKSVEGYLEHSIHDGEEGRHTPVYLTEMDRERILANQASKPPFRCGMTSYENRSSSLKEGCPVALRAELLGDKYSCCRCRKREIPFITDLAYDRFIKESVPHTQLLVVSIVSSRNPTVTQCTSMVEQLYYEKNRNRSFPCAQSRSDSYRIVLYNVDNVFKIHRPLLVQRHNVIPGMFLMYIGGKLLFADHIFNGYGNARKDFLKQIAKTRKDYLQGLFLPSDFRFNPTPCRSGPRAAWGGEIGGISRSALRHSLDSGIKLCVTSAVGGRLPSAGTTVSSSESVVRANGTKSAASFVNLGLAINSPLFTRNIKSSSSLQRKTAPAKSRA